MATSRQEKTYNEIIEYYNYADRLVLEAENSVDAKAVEQFSIIEEIVENVENNADRLATIYLEYVKSGEEKNIIESMHKALDDIMKKIEECRNKILALFNA